MNRVATMGSLIQCIQAGPGGPVKRRGQWCYRDDLCYPNTFHTVNCPNPLPPDLGRSLPGSDNPKFGIVITGLILGGLWLVFGVRKN